MVRILACTIAAVIDRYHEEQRAHRQRQGAIEGALSKLGFFATEQEKARAAIAAREAIGRLDAEAGEIELRTIAEEAVQPIQQAVEKRLQNERLLKWAIRQLPWSRTDLDESESAAGMRRNTGRIVRGLFGRGGQGSVGANRFRSMPVHRETPPPARTTNTRNAIVALFQFL